MASQESESLIQEANRVVFDYTARSFGDAINKCSGEGLIDLNAISDLESWVSFLRNGNEFRTNQKLGELLKRGEKLLDEIRARGGKKNSKSCGEFDGEFWGRYSNITSAVFVVQEICRILGEERSEDEILLGMFRDSDEWKKILAEGVNTSRIFEYFEKNTEFRPFYMSGADLRDLREELERYNVPPILRIKNDFGYGYPENFCWVLFKGVDDYYKIVNLSSFRSQVGLNIGEFQRVWQDERGEKFYLAVRYPRGYEDRKNIR